MKKIDIETVIITRYDNVEGSLRSRSMECDYCGKEFFGNKSSHSYKRTVNRSRKYYCSYTCFRQSVKMPSK